MSLYFTLFPLFPLELQEDVMGLPPLPFLFPVISQRPILGAGGVFSLVAYSEFFGGIFRVLHDLVDISELFWWYIPPFSEYTTRFINLVALRNFFVRQTSGGGLKNLVA